MPLLLFLLLLQGCGGSSSADPTEPHSSTPVTPSVTLNQFDDIDVGIGSEGIASQIQYDLGQATFHKQEVTDSWGWTTVHMMRTQESASYGTGWKSPIFAQHYNRADSHGSPTMDGSSIVGQCVLSFTDQGRCISGVFEAHTADNGAEGLLFSGEFGLRNTSSVQSDVDSIYAKTNMWMATHTLDGFNRATSVLTMAPSDQWVHGFWMRGISNEAIHIEGSNTKYGINLSGSFNYPIVLPSNNGIYTASLQELLAVKGSDTYLLIDGVPRRLTVSSDGVVRAH